jgi:hypothetical protein
MDPDDGNHEPNRKGCHREVGSEGSGTQTPGPRHTKRIGGIYSWARGQIDPKPDSHPEGVDVYATGIWEESRCAIPGEICSSALVLLPSRDGRMDEQKSAEGIRASVQ